ncbi:kinetochore protein Spc24 [Lingula anatina]|uniref:Kinetochore protein Spc24 n=1 Tax=Lingula anatina TaxID=7574 RepID=A0A1S3JLC4_LINAN|nr:kinetochore protein Spc24 [Lingula anatina]XP_013411179.1 kinetochore protein Spc24 [Lingula anatina]XP_013411180.1 kinetochore protein Spc24 [Lingula anatina]|eukprot:XP_013411178.1 kinetochore protein Spc24 [Lingula anatina]
MPGTEEARSIVSELITVLNQDEELTKLQAAGEIVDKINQLRRAQEEAIRNDIHALSTMIDEEESLVAGSQSDEALDKGMGELAAQMEQAQQHKSHVAQELATTKGNIEQMKSLKEDVEAKKEQVKHKTTEALPKLRHDVNLYHSISNIRWQYDCEPDEIKGYLCNKHDVKPFSMNSKQNSQFFIVNYLWDLMETDW